MSIQIIKVKQNSPEWLELRKGKVTGSNAETLLTRNLDEAIKDNFKEFNGNYFTKRGHILEEEAIELLEAIYNCKVDRPGMVVNDKFNNASCSPDGICWSFIWPDRPEELKVLVEVKCFGEKNHRYVKHKRNIPFKIMAQLQFNMMICELEWSILVMYNPDIEDNNEAFKVFLVKANKKIQANMREKLK